MTVCVERCRKEQPEEPEAHLGALTSSCPDVGVGRACPIQACHVPLFRKAQPQRVQLDLLSAWRSEHTVP